ncbi:hypothetical protein [Enterococcus malodoratus]|nr:hypothetical protein [Enterococcus malodoratus]
MDTKEIVEMVKYYERKIAVLEAIIKELQRDNEDQDLQLQKLKEDGE